MAFGPSMSGGLGGAIGASGAGGWSHPLGRTSTPTAPGTTPPPAAPGPVTPTGGAVKPTPTAAAPSPFSFDAFRQKAETAARQAITSQRVADISDKTRYTPPVAHLAGLEPSGFGHSALGAAQKFVRGRPEMTASAAGMLAPGIVGPLLGTGVGLPVLGALHGLLEGGDSFGAAGLYAKPLLDRLGIDVGGSPTAATAPPAAPTSPAPPTIPMTS